MFLSPPTFNYRRDTLAEVVEPAQACVRWHRGTKSGAPQSSSSALEERRGQHGAARVCM